jgi:hypothetical protein
LGTMTGPENGSCGAGVEGAAVDVVGMEMPVGRP